ncbi:Ig-like domain-containing protein [Myxococcus stipitatus]|uniref:Ig-like domain-containing protein n=1 Tax=Myxococcus stipitatus TaxID=83455 RepID=UPI00314567CB
MTNRLRLLTPLFSFFLLFGCINVPEVVDPPDGGGDRPDGGGADGGENPAHDFELGVAPQEETVLQGGAKSFLVSVVRKNGFQGSVAVVLANPPSGVSAPSVTIPASGTTATLNVSVAANVAPLSLTLTVRGISGTIQRDRSVVLNVVPQGSLAVSWVSPTESRSVVNGPLALEVSVEGGQAEQVELLKGDTVIQTWTSAPYRYQWDTEGEFTLKARATRGGSTYVSSERVVVVDRSAPRVESRQPAAGATQVSVQTPIQVTFNEPVRASSVTAANVGLSASGGTAIPSTVALSADGRTLTVTVTPPNVLPTSTTVTVNLGTNGQPIVDMAGNALTAEGTWSFTVPYWLPMGGAISEYPGSTSAEDVVLRIGTNGVPHIAWSESDGASRNIIVARWTGSAWVRLGTPLSALSENGTHADHPDMALDSSSNPTVIWDESTSDDVNRNLYGRRWTGSDWAVLPSFPPVSAGDHEQREYASIAFDGNGHLHLYTSIRDLSSRLEGFYLPPAGSAWMNSPTAFPREGLQPWGVSIATYGSNSIFAAYSTLLETETSSFRGITVLKNHSIEVGPPLIINSNGARAETPSITVDGAGNPYVAWVEYPPRSTDGSIFVANHDGSSWKFLDEKPSQFMTSNQAPTLVIDHQGRPVIAWSGFQTPERAIFVKRWEGNHWSSMGSALSIFPGANTGSFAPSLAMENGGHFMVAWHEFNGAASDIFVVKANR